MSMAASTLTRMVLGFLGVIIAARVIPQDRYGLYFLFLAMVALLSVIGSFGLRMSAATFVAAAPSEPERQAIVNNLLTFRLLTVVIVSGLAIVGKPILLLFFPSESLSLLFIYAPILYAVELTERTLDGIMQGLHLYKQMAFVQSLTGILNFALILLFLLFLKVGIVGLILASILSLSAAVLLQYWMIPTPKALAFDLAVLRRIVRFALPLQGNEILSFIHMRAGVLMLGALMGPSQIAYLEVAAKIPQNLGQLLRSFYSVYLPYMSGLFGQGQQAQAEAVLTRFLRLTAFMTMLCACIVILFQREIVLLVFSETYLPSAPALGLLMMVLGLSLGGTILDLTLIAAGHSGYAPLFGLVDAGLRVLANLLLIPTYGFMGAVIANLVSNAISNPLVVLALRRENIRVRLGEYLKPMLVLVACLGLYVGIGWDTIVFKGRLILLFIGLCTGFSVVTGRDVALGLNSVRRPQATTGVSSGM